MSGEQTTSVSLNEGPSPILVHRQAVVEKAACVIKTGKVSRAFNQMEKMYEKGLSRITAGRLTKEKQKRWIKNLFRPGKRSTMP